MQFKSILPACSHFCSLLTQCQQCVFKVLLLLTKWQRSSFNISVNRDFPFPLSWIRLLLSASVKFSSLWKYQIHIMEQYYELILRWNRKLEIPRPGGLQIGASWIFIMTDLNLDPLHAVSAFKELGSQCLNFMLTMVHCWNISNITIC